MPLAVDPDTLLACQVFWLLTVDHLTGRRPSHDVQVGCAVALLADLLAAGALGGEDAGVVTGGGRPEPPWLAALVDRYRGWAGPDPVRWEHVLTPLVPTAWDDVAASLGASGWVVHRPGRWLGHGAPQYATAEDAPVPRLRSAADSALEGRQPATDRTRSVVLAAVVSGSVAALFRPVGWAVDPAVEQVAQRLVADDPRLERLRRTVAFSDGWASVHAPRP